MASCKSNDMFNACPDWHVATNLASCQAGGSPGSDVFPTVGTCQGATGTCMHPEMAAMSARWALTPPVKPGKMSRVHPYPCDHTQSFGFNPLANACVPVLGGKGGGPTSCVTSHAPFVYKGLTY